MNQFLYTAGLQKDSDCISSAVSLGDFICIGCQYGEGDTLEEQCISVINKVKDVVENLGAELRHVIKYTLYLSDMDMKQSFLSIYKNYVEAPYPVMTIVEVKGLEGNAMVGLEAFAINTTRYEKSNCNHDCSDCSGECANH